MLRNGMRQVAPSNWYRWILPAIRSWIFNKPSRHCARQFSMVNMHLLKEYSMRLKKLKGSTGQHASQLVEISSLARKGKPNTRYGHFRLPLRIWGPNTGNSSDQYIGEIFLTFSSSGTEWNGLVLLAHLVGYFSLVVRLIFSLLTFNNWLIVNLLFIAPCFWNSAFIFRWTEEHSGLPSTGMNKKFDKISMRFFGSTFVPQGHSEGRFGNGPVCFEFYPLSSGKTIQFPPFRIHRTVSLQCSLGVLRLRLLSLFKPNTLAMVSLFIALVLMDKLPVGERST